MSLKSIRESYAKLLTVFKDTGVNLTEAQKNDMDSFIMSLEETMSEQRKDAIKKAKKLTEAKLEKEYSALFEEITKNANANAKLEAKIRSTQAAIDESNRLADKVSDYLDLYVESILPKKDLVDYERMHKLEAIHESLKNSLMMSEDDVVEAKQKLEKSFAKKQDKLETEVARAQAKLSESISANKRMQKKLDQYKAMDLLESKTSDLPSFEATKVKKILSEASTHEIEKRFDETLAKVKEDTKNLCRVSEKTLNEELNRIINEEPEPETECEKPVVQKPVDENFETLEEIQFDENNDVVLTEEDVIDESTMNYYCNLVK